MINYTPRAWAVPFHASFKRFAVLVLHRRAGKTTGILQHHQRAALSDEWELARLRAVEPSVSESAFRPLLVDRHYIHILPTLEQGRLVAWPILKRISANVPGARPNEDTMTMSYQNGCRVQILGANKPDTLRGIAPSGASFDEFAQHPPNIFGEIVSKALADHLGYAVFAGTIKGKNHLFKMHQQAVKMPETWFSLWLTVQDSLRQETDIAVKVLKKAMEDDQVLIEQGLMTLEEFNQEWFLNPDAAIRGGIFTKELSEARNEKRIGVVPINPDLPVDTDWDLGVNDSMAIWLSQTFPSGAVSVVDYYENNNQGIGFYINKLREIQQKRGGFVWGTHNAPHDIEVRELSSGKTRKQVARGLGIAFRNTPKLNKGDQIRSARSLLKRCFFDEQHTDPGLEALRNYQWKWNSRLKQFESTPEHNWASNGSDAFLGLSVRTRTPQLVSAMNETEQDRSARLYSRGGDPLSWMGGV